MDFSYNEIQAMLDDSVEKFIANDYDFETRQKYAASEKAYSPEVWQTFAELGWTSVPFSEDDGGFGGGPADLMVLMLRFGKGLVVEPYLANIVLAGGVLRRAADAEQKQKWLHPIIAGELQAALAYAEPQSRYDIGDVRTTARADGGGWVISGDKSVVFNGGNAELLPDRDGVRRLPAHGLRQADGRFDETAVTAVLLALRAQAEKALARPVTHAVVAIERVDDAARQALVVAAAGAGLQVLRVIAANGAAALVSNASPVDAAVLGAAVAAEEDAARLSPG